MSKYTFNEIVTKIEQDDFGKNDITVPMGHTFMNNDGKICIGSDIYDPTDYALSQVFGKVGMPITYEKRLLSERPELVAEQYNYFKQKVGYTGKPVLMRYREVGNQRTLRAFLSDVYSPLDNKDIYKAFGFVMNNADNLEIEDMYLDDVRSRMRVTIPEMSRSAGETKYGLNDIIKVGFDIINSEVGRSSLLVSPMVYRLVCLNGLKVWQHDGDVFKQRHAFVPDIELRAMLAHAISNSVRGGDELISQFIETRDYIVDDPLKVIESLGKRQQYSDKFIELTKDSWRIEPDENTYGVINAFTRAAQNMSDETRLEIESFAGSLVHMKGLRADAEELN